MGNSIMSSSLLSWLFDKKRKKKKKKKRLNKENDQKGSSWRFLRLSNLLSFLLCVASPYKPRGQIRQQQQSSAEQ